MNVYQYKECRKIKKCLYIDTKLALVVATISNLPLRMIPCLGACIALLWKIRMSQWLWYIPVVVLPIICSLCNNFSIQSSWNCPTIVGCHKALNLLTSSHLLISLTCDYLNSLQSHIPLGCHNNHLMSSLVSISS